jgi:hypothetical protein
MAVGLSRIGIRSALPAAVVLGALATFSLLLVAKPPMLEMAAWGLCVLASFWGYGVLAARVAYPDTRVPATFACILGAGFHICMGSVFTATRVMNKTVGVVSVLVGCVFAAPSLSRALVNAFARSRRRLKYAKRVPWIAILATLPALLLVAAYVHGSSIIWLNPYDDELAYMTFPKQMVETGSFADPFSLRRVASYGGQSYLHALLISAGNLEYFGILDRGIFFLLSLSAIRALRIQGRRPPYLMTLATMSMLLVLQNIAINCASHYSGLAGFLALYFVLSLGQIQLERDAYSVSSGIRSTVGLILVGTLLATLRQNFLPVVAIAIAVHLFFVLRKRANTALTMAALTAIGSALALAGWIVQIRESSGTALFPLQPGFLRPAFTMRSPSMTTFDEIRFYLDALTWHEPFPGWPLAFLAIPFVRVLRRQQALLALCLGSMVGYILLVHSFTLSNAENFARYSFSFVLATFLIAILVLSTYWFSSVRNAYSAAQAKAFLLAWFASVALLSQGRTFFWWTYKSVAHHIHFGSWRPQNVHLYSRAQATLPVGATALTMTDEPYNFSYARNVIYNLDVPGALSPAPGLPFFGPVEEVDRYLEQQAIRYLVYVRHEASHGNYIRPYWFARFFIDDEIWRRHAPYYIYIFDTLEALSKRHRILFEERGVVVLDLQQRSAASQ